MMMMIVSIVVIVFFCGFACLERCRADGPSCRGHTLARRFGDTSFRLLVTLRIKPIFPAIYGNMAISTFEIRAMALMINRFTFE